MSAKSASPITAKKNAAQNNREFDPIDLERVQRGFIAKRESGLINDAEGRFVYDSDSFEFLRDGRDCPDTVNPHLWRHATLNAHHGLFEVAEGVWHVRGYDISNITFIKGDQGWIVIDPLTSQATARASYELVTKHLGHRPITAVIYTHSHADHLVEYSASRRKKKWMRASAGLLRPCISFKRPLAKTSLLALQWDGVLPTNSARSCRAAPKGMWTAVSVPQHLRAHPRCLHQPKTSHSRVRNLLSTEYASFSNSRQKPKHRQK